MKQSAFLVLGQSQARQSLISDFN